MSRSFWKFSILPAALLVLSAAPSLAQQVKGDSEVGLSGSFTIQPNTTKEPATVSSSGVTLTYQNVTTYTDTGIISVNYGYYFTRHDLIGIADAISVSGTSGGNQSTTSGFNTSNTFYARYRHLFGGESAKVYPFVGAGGGVISMSMPSTTISGTTTSTTTSTTADGLYSFEGGLKFYVNPKTAFEIAYAYQAFSESNGASGGSTTVSQDVISFGFTYVFGGPRSKH